MGSLGALPPYPQGQAVHECACLWPGARSTWWSWQLPKPSGPVAESAGPAAVALAGGGARGATCLAGGGRGRRCLPSRLGVRAVSAASAGSEALPRANELQPTLAERTQLSPPSGPLSTAGSEGGGRAGVPGNSPRPDSLAWSALGADSSSCSLLCGACSQERMGRRPRPWGRSAVPGPPEGERWGRPARSCLLCGPERCESCLWVSQCT